MIISIAIYFISRIDMNQFDIIFHKNNIPKISYSHTLYQNFICFHEEHSLHLSLTSI